MKVTYTGLKNQFLRNIGSVGTVDTSILADFNSNLSQRYQMVLSHLKDYQSQQPKTASSVVGQQYYHYPVGVSRIDNVMATINNVLYPLKVINSQFEWNRLNSIQIQPSVFPQFVFPRRDDFGIWPIPQTVYTLTFYYYMRDRDLAVEDYTTGTVDLTNGSADVVGTNTVWTPGMVGRWFHVTDTTSADYGYWYRISNYNSPTSITLDNSWQGDTTSTDVSYLIGQCPEIPEEGHIILADGATADYYSGIRADAVKSTAWNNKFWTGDMNNNNRKLGDDTVKGGLIGLVNSYADRDNGALVNRRPRTYGPATIVWGTTLS
jgi:hypothetical protein